MHVKKAEPLEIYIVTSSKQAFGGFLAVRVRSRGVLS